MLSGLFQYTGEDTCQFILCSSDQRRCKKEKTKVTGSCGFHGLTYQEARVWSLVAGDTKGPVDYHSPLACFCLKVVSLRSQGSCCKQCLSPGPGDEGHILQGLYS